MLESFLEKVADRTRHDWELVHHEEIPEKPPQLEEIPAQVHPRVADMIRSSGIQRLYSHQADAVRLALKGRNVVLATNTASGKTLAFQASVIDRLIRDPASHGLFLFPLKALERDQRDAFVALAAQDGLTSAIYDGDTPESERRKIRRNPPRVLITNPDMLHLGLLAYHDSWRDFFSALCYVVLDEVHTYKGIFGSHIAEVLLRMRRVCNMYGANPQFFASSATVANPGEFVSRLIGEETAVVDRSGAPSSKRHFLFLQPVLSPYTVAARLFINALDSGLKTICFTRARKITELITTWVMQQAPHLRGRISSYRAGFLPEERREIESKLFSGKMAGVISTSALEMGIDVGGLDLCLLVGYPGTIINTWQRGGRVGRSGRQSAIVLIAGHDALDQYFLKHPQDFFGRSCEEAIVDPLNKEVLKRHIPCAAAETPIREDEEWTRQPEVRSILKELETEGAIYQTHEDHVWYSSRKRPHRGVDLRGIGESFAIFLEGRKTLIGSSSGVKVFTECHEGAIYLHRTRQYVVTRLDLDRRNAIVKLTKANYYTRGLSEKDTEIIGAPLDQREFPGFTVREGILKVTQNITAYEKRRTTSQELIGIVDLDLPPILFETVGIWIEIPDRVKQAVQAAGLHFMGGIHALEHAAISMFPLFALCDRDDIGGISTQHHEQVCSAAVFIYDGHPGGVGLSHHIFGRVEELLEKTRSLVGDCPCEDGCPSCIHSPKCGSGNKPLDKKACLAVLQCLLEPDKMELPHKKPRPPAIFPDLAGPGSKPKRPDRKITGPDHNDAPTREKMGSGSRLEEVKRVLIFDLETQKSAEEVGGWKNIALMKLSLGVTYSEEDGFLTFTENNVEDLVRLLKRADLVVGFNQMRFDYEVLSAYTTDDLRALPNLDILVVVQRVLGFRLSLDHLGKFTLGMQKSGHGLEAIRWFREGKMDLLEKYCREDVRITRDLYRFGLEKGYLLYKRKNGAVARIPVDWRSPTSQA